MKKKTSIIVIVCILIVAIGAVLAMSGRNATSGTQESTQGSAALESTTSKNPTEGATESTGSTEGSEPTQPESSEPTQPEATEPTQPESSEPTQPETTEPTQPETTEPTQPETTEPTQPETNEPTQPEATEPTQPETTEPTQPEATEPTQPETTEPVHTHSYTDAVIAPTCTENGYTIHKCACGEEYKDSEVAAKGHTYTDTTIAPTCESGGYTVHRCSCGYEYSDTQTAALGHQYTDKVVDPTASEQGYTEHVCKICGFTYRDNYKDKLPPEETDPGKDDEHDGNGMVDAGVFGQHSSESAPVYDGSTDYNAVVNKLNGYIFDVYGLTFYRNGLGQNDNQNLGTAKIVQNADGKFGITIIGWRKSYDSSATVNTQLNAVLEAMRYFAKGKSNVAYGLWSWNDARNINGWANSDNYGFHDVEETSVGWIIEMDGVQILADESVSGQTTYWFI